MKIHEDINHNMAIVKKLITSRSGSFEAPTSKWLLNETEKGDEVKLEIHQVTTQHVTWVEWVDDRREIHTVCVCTHNRA